MTAVATAATTTMTRSRSTTTTRWRSAIIGTSEAKTTVLLRVTTTTTTTLMMLTTTTMMKMATTAATVTRGAAAAAAAAATGSRVRRSTRSQASCRRATRPPSSAPNTRSRCCRHAKVRGCKLAVASSARLSAMAGTSRSTAQTRGRRARGRARRHAGVVAARRRRRRDRQGARDAAARVRASTSAASRVGGGAVHELPQVRRRPVRHDRWHRARQGVGVPADHGYDESVRHASCPPSSLVLTPIADRCRHLECRREPAV